MWRPLRENSDLSAPHLSQPMVVGGSLPDESTLTPGGQQNLATLLPGIWFSVP